MRYCFFIALIGCLVIANDVSGQVTDSLEVVAKGAVLQKLPQQFTFTEGPAVDKLGNIYFTDQPNDKIWKYNVDGKLSLFMDKTRRSNGLYFDRKGNLLSCADENGQLISIAPDKKITVLLDNINGLQMNGPNDLWLDKTGGIYFTDPYYQRDYWQRKKPDLDKQEVYYLPKGKKVAEVADSTLKQPNGIVGTQDGKYLYVADLRGFKTYRYEINANGQLANRIEFAPMGSDGMTLDENGNLYLTGKGVTVFDPTGKKLGNIPVPAGWVGNVCFGGSDRHLLFITASESVFTLQMKVKGVE